MKKTNAFEGAVSVADLKAHLSEALDQVRAGAELVVTKRGRPVARLLGWEAGSLTPSLPLDLVRRGLVRLPEARLPADFLDAEIPSDPTGRGVEALLEDRLDGR